MSRFSDTADGIGSYMLKNGERRYRVVMKVGGITRSRGGFRSKGEARAWRDKTRSEVHRGEYVELAKARTLFGTFAEDWLATADLRPTTRANYRHLLDHQLAAWADVPLCNITSTAVRQWVGKLRSTPRPRTKRPPARSSVVKAYGVLKHILKVAAEEGYIQRNPCNVDMGKDVKPDLYCPTPAEVMTLAGLVPANYRALVLVAGYGGLRWGEAVALRRKNVDVANGCVYVKEAVVETIEHAMYLQPMLKTEAGERTVYLPAAVVSALALHLANHAEAGPDGLLFYASRTTPGSRPYLRRTNWTQRVWKPAVKASGLPHVRFHDLRHAAATLAAQSGATTAELMAHIGHASPQASLRYQHAADDRMRSLSGRLDALIPDPHAATGTDNVVPLFPK
jgi:integrase